MKRRMYFYLPLAIIGIVAFYIFLHPWVLIFSATKFGALELGGQIPIGEGSETFAPPRWIPKSKFYINVVQKDLWCVFEFCSVYGKSIKNAGGWLQGEDYDQVTIRDIFGLWNNPHFISIVVVGDKEGKIVGIYPNKDVDDLGYILKKHSGLIKGS